MKKLDEKFDQFRKEFRDEQEKVATSAARKARQEPRYKFKKKAHEEQSQVNEKVDEAIKEAESELQTGGSSSAPSAGNIKAALESLKQGRLLLAERQKLIKIADRSELGWAVVSEYTADELADDSDDEKRMEKAEKAAERKAARKRKAVPASDRTKAARRSVVHDMQPRLSVPFANHQVIRRVPIQSSTPKQLGPCYSCGQMGHLKHYCPKLSVPSSSNKTIWYPSHKVLSGTESDMVDIGVLVDYVCSGGIPALNQSESPSEVLSEGESHVQSCGVQTLGAADQLSHQQDARACHCLSMVYNTTLRKKVKVFDSKKANQSFSLPLIKVTCCWSSQRTCALSWYNCAGAL